MWKSPGFRRSAHGACEAAFAGEGRKGLILRSADRLGRPETVRSRRKSRDSSFGTGVHHERQQHLGPGPHPDRDEGQPSQLLHLVQAHRRLSSDDGAALRIRVPNSLFRDWLTKHYSAVLDEALGEVDRKGTAVNFVTDEASAAPSEAPAPDGPSTLPRRAPPPRTTAGRRSRAPLFLRHLHRRLVEPVRARRLPRGRRGAVALVQPAVHLRRRRSRQDAPDARDRALRAQRT